MTTIKVVSRGWSNGEYVIDTSTFENDRGCSLSTFIGNMVKFGGLYLDSKTWIPYHQVLRVREE